MFIQARNYHQGRVRKPRLIVIHTMESAEKPGTALAVAKWFAGASAPQASAHFCIDSTQVIQCVKESDTAWATPGANADGFQLEHAGIAAQTPARWADDFSRATLVNSARLAAEIAPRYGIPIRHLTNAELAAGKPGFIGHVQASQVYRKSNHTDPGGSFPWTDYLAMVTAVVNGTTPPTNQGDDMGLDRNDIDLMFKGGKSTGPKDVRAVYQVRDGKDLLGITDAMGRQLALLRQIAAGQVDYDRLAAAIVARGGTSVDPQTIADAVVDHLADRLTDG